jgi:CarD family transcriptional regulator
MFYIQDVIIHKKLGLCTIIDKTEINNTEYYILNKNEDTVKVMVPIDNASNFIRRPMTRKEIQKLKEKYKECNIEIILDYKTRIKKYDELLKSGEIDNLIILFKMIYTHKKSKNNLTQADKDILKQAEKLLFNEIAYVLNINEDEVKKEIFKKKTSNFLVTR